MPAEAALASLSLPAEPARPRVDVALGEVALTGAARAAVVAALVPSVAYSLQQCPCQLHELRAWRARLEQAEAAALATRGRRLPRGLQARRAAAFASRCDAMLDGLRALCAAKRVLAVTLVLGPGALAPRFVVHVAFDEGAGGAALPLLRAPAAARLLARVAAEREGRAEVGDSMEVEVAAPPAADAAAAPPTHRIGAGPYSAPLAPDVAGAVARKAARQLIVESAAVYGMQPVAPNRLLLFALCLPLQQEHGAGGEGDIVDDEAVAASVALPSGWLPKPGFALRPPRALRARTRVRRVAVAAESDGKSGEGSELLRRVRERCVEWGPAKYRLVTVNVFGGECHDGPPFREAEPAAWVAWHAPPQAFRGRLPPVPTLRVAPPPAATARANQR